MSLKKQSSVDNEYRPVVGIDLGTTFSCLARWDGKGPVVCQTKTGRNVTPSVVYFDGKQKNELVGDVAVTFSHIDPQNGIFCIKREMGNKDYRVNLGGKTYSPVDIAALILKKVVGDLEEKYPPQANFSIQGAVVTVPYHFNSNQRADTEEAAKKAGLNLLGILNEPTAAALAYGLHLAPSLNRQEAETILVFDLGGGTFDVTIFRLVDSPEKLLVEVLATGGDSRLGGTDFDDALSREVLKRADLNLEELDPKTRTLAARYLTESVISCKERLSYEVENDFVAVPNIVPGKSIHVTITKKDFEAIIQPYTERIRDILHDTLAQAGLGGAINRVIKVGGSSKIPLMNTLIEEVTGQLPYGTLEPDLAVALGAAIYAAILDGRLEHKPIEIVDVISHSLGIETAGGRFQILIPRNRKVPCEVTQIFGTTQDQETEVSVNVYQGSAAEVAQNTLIGKVEVKGLLPRPAGDLDIRVTFKASAEQKISLIIEQPESGIHLVKHLQRA